MLTGEQLQQFHRDGLLVVRDVFGRDEVRALQQAADQVTREGLAGDGAGHGYRDVDDRREYYRTDGVLWERQAAFRIATVHPRLLAAVGQCLGHPFMPVNDALVVKRPRSGVAIPWHQDPPYQGPDGRAETFGIPNFDCDIYLDAATTDNGCLYGLAGHHLAGHVELERFSDQELFDRTGAVPLEMEPGDVLLHAISAPHGSKANDSDTLRRVLYVHYMAHEVLETLYPQWVGTRRGFAQGDLEQAQAMIEERVGAGLAAPGAAQVELTADGFVFTGEPITPPQHWHVLLADQAPRQVQAAKTSLHDV